MLQSQPRAWPREPDPAAPVPAGAVDEPGGDGARLLRARAGAGGRGVTPASGSFSGACKVSKPSNPNPGRVGTPTAVSRKPRPGDPVRARHGVRGEVDHAVPSCRYRGSFVLGTVPRRAGCRQLPALSTGESARAPVLSKFLRALPVVAGAPGGWTALLRSQPQTCWKDLRMPLGLPLRTKLCQLRSRSGKVSKGSLCRGVDKHFRAGAWRACPPACRDAGLVRQLCLS